MTDTQESLAISSAGQVTCLGQVFATEAARCAHYKELLREKLQDPKFRATEGFPLGEDEDILALSDPPYYTACPNPWLTEMVTAWQDAKSTLVAAYHREPFAADVSEGKSHPIYKAHVYHTKVPHKAIMRYILHYTEPGDVVLDGFCGTGMTGVAAQLCGDANAVRELGYIVDADGTIRHQTPDTLGELKWMPFSKLGTRHAVLNDLSPAAAFIAHNYNTPADLDFFNSEVLRILNDAEHEYKWMYSTTHHDGSHATINYILWSDVLVCHSCSNDIEYFNVAFDKKAGLIRDEFDCPHCGAVLIKSKLSRAWETIYDPVLQQNIRHATQIPVLINYRTAGSKKQLDKTPDTNDIALIRKIQSLDVSGFPLPIRMIDGEKTNGPLSSHGISHVHHYFTKRNMHIIAALWRRFDAFPRGRILLTSILQKTAGKLHNIGFRGGKINLAGALPNTLFVPSALAERNLFILLQGKLKDFQKGLDLPIRARNILSTGNFSFDNFSKVPADTMDYIFVDPPFGSNLQYSELNFLWESWLKVWTSTTPEAIESKSQDKGREEYGDLMLKCFREAYRVLKPGRWMTVEFSNTKAEIWKAIQHAIAEAGFVVANVNFLNKQQGTYNAQTSSTAVIKDLVISAYKPTGGFDVRFQSVRTTSAAPWVFIDTHMCYLPTQRIDQGVVGGIDERTPRKLYDSLLAYFVQQSLPVPLSSDEFQQELAVRYSEADGMYFLPDQLTTYQHWKASKLEVRQPSMFLEDEATTIVWLRDLLVRSPLIFAEINARYMQKFNNNSWKKGERTFELKDLLEENFVRYDGDGAVPEQIARYLRASWRDLPNDDSGMVAEANELWYVPDPNVASDLARRRTQALLREYAGYHGQKRLKEFRRDAMYEGLRRAWGNGNYREIIDMCAKISPSSIIDQDAQLMRWRDNARTRADDEQLIP